MATDIRSLPAFNVDAAAFRTWAQGVHAALLACGLVATADTGQADLATIVGPTSAQSGIFSGFKMYRFDDALQATKPVFIKVEFGTGSTGGRLALALTVGSATNGAGGFPGASVTTRWTGGGNAIKASGQVSDQYASGSQAGAGGGRIHLHTLFDVSAQYSTSIIVERLKNGDGSAHASGALFVGFLSGLASNQVRAQMMVPGLPPTGVISAWPILPLAHSDGTIHQPNVGTDLALSPLMIADGVWLYAWPLHYRAADLVSLVPFTMEHLGAEHTFMPFGINLSTFPLPIGGVAASAGMAFPWE